MLGAWVVLCVTSVAEPATAPRWETALALGVELPMGPLGERASEVVLGAELARVGEFTSDLGWRAEALVASGSAGDPTGRGVEAVRVARLEVHSALVAGLTYRLWHRHDAVLRAVVAAGPELLLRRVTIEVRGETDAVTNVALAARVAAGVLVEAGLLRVGARLETAVPEGAPGASALLGVAF